MISIETILTIIPSLLGIIAVWVNLNRDIEKLKGRVIRVENDKDELKQMMKEVIESVHKIELLRAKKWSISSLKNLRVPTNRERVV